MSLGSWIILAQIITTPKSGWRFGMEAPPYLQPVNYPATVVTMPEKRSDVGVIEGNFPGGGTGQGELVVNGLPLPMRVEGGKFQRPYSFGPGSNSVVARSPDGKEKQAVQFYEANPRMAQPLVRVILAWDTDGTDLDLHVVTPDGEHCSYANRVLQNGGALDVDVTSGYGPEIFATPAPVPGTYLVFVNYYGGPDGSRDLTTATVHVVTNENTVDEKKLTFTVPLRKPGELNHVATFVY